MSDGVMYIHRSAPSRNYTVVRNQIFEAGLGVEALGLLTYLISRPAAWVVSQEQLRKLFGLGRERLTRIIKELEEAGYVKREQRRDPVTKSFGKMEFYVYDEPAGAAEASEDSVEEEAPDVPLTGEPLTAKPHTADPDHGEPQTAIGMVENNNINNNKYINPPLPPNGKRRRRKRRQDETPVPPDRQQVFVEQWSPQWKAWSATRAKPWPTTDYRDPRTGSYRTGWWFPGEWPQGHEPAEAPQGCREVEGA